jgi:cation diffusion facilitator family transporter
MEKQEQTQAASQMQSVTVLALAANIVLFFVKIAVGVAAGSVSLVADGIHSLSDMVTDFSVMLGVYLGSKKPDQLHPYGHGRAETFAALFISLCLLAVGMGMIYYAAQGLTKQDNVKPHLMVLVVALASIVTKELLYRVTKLVARKYHSAALYANAWHHRSDAFSSVAVVIGFIAMEFGYGYGDHIAAIAVGLTIALVALQILSQCFGELAERAVDNETVEHIKAIINSNPQIKQWHKLRTRTIAREIFLDLHILVDKGLSVVDAHNIAEQLEQTLHSELSRPVNITVHVEPDIPELRK